MAVLFLSPTHAQTDTNDPKYVVPCGMKKREGNCTKTHPRVYVICRVAADQMGHFMVFRVSGQEHPWDASLPGHFETMPRDAVEIPDELAQKMWHCTCGSHVFGCCYLSEAHTFSKHLAENRGRRRFRRYY